MIDLLDSYRNMMSTGIFPATRIPSLLLSREGKKEQPTEPIYSITSCSNLLRHLRQLIKEC